MSSHQRKAFCEFLTHIKVPDGYSAKISHYVDAKNSKIFGMKCHDCHVFLHRYLPLSIHGVLPVDVFEAIIELCNFFRELCFKKLDMELLKKLDSSIAHLPELPRGRTTSPRLLLLFPRCRPPSSRLCCLARAAADVAIAFPGTATPSSSPASPYPRQKLAGSVSSSTSGGVAATVPPQPPMPPRRCVGCRRHLLSRHNSAVLFPGQATASPEFRRNTAVPRRPLHPPRRNFPGRPFLHPCAVGRATTTSGIAAVSRRRRPWLRLPFSSTCRRSSSPPRRFPSSSSRHSRPVVVFVLGSASSSVAPAASRLRPRIAAEVVPSPFASVVPKPSPPRPFVVVVPTPRCVVLLSFWRFLKRGSRSSPKVRKAVLYEQGKSHHP
uniref:Putative transposon protein n=1 Tax=Oryza sativa subsp. japonica TaxID=39947 RepID=Q6UUN2_ORYSJ|nr:putative transposon protein [Oryza sativa Japonica Group]